MGVAAAAGFPGIVVLFILGFAAVFVFGARSAVMRPYAEGYKTAVVNHHLHQRQPLWQQPRRDDCGAENGAEND